METMYPNYKFYLRDKAKLWLPHLFSHELLSRRKVRTSFVLAKDEIVALGCGWQMSPKAKPKPAIDSYK